MIGLTVVDHVSDTQFVKRHGEAHVRSWPASKLVLHHLIKYELMLERIVWTIHFSGDAAMVVVNFGNGPIDLGYVEKFAESSILL
jgi:hypothetical protein